MGNSSERGFSNCLLLDADVLHCSVIMLMETNTKLPLSFGFVSSAETQLPECGQESVLLSFSHYSGIFVLPALILFHINRFNVAVATVNVSFGCGKRVFGEFRALRVCVELIVRSVGV